MATFDDHVNLARTTVLTPPSPALSGTSMVLASAGWANGAVAPFNCTVVPSPGTGAAEIVRVLAYSGATISSMLRAQEGTSAIAIAATDLFGITVTAKNLKDIEVAVNALPQSAIQSVSAGTQIATGPQINFANSNGLSFGMSGSSQITASYTVPSVAGLLSAINLSAGTLSSDLSAVTLADSNGVSFGLNTNGVVTASHNGITSQSAQTQSNVQGISAGTQVGRTGDIVLSNSNGISFGMSGSTRITASYTVPGATVFSNSNNVTFGLNGSTVTATATFAQSVQTQSNVQGISAGTQVGRTGDIVFSNSNGISFGMSGSTQVTASYTVPSTAGLISALNFSGGTTSNNLSAITFSNSNGISFGLNASTMTASHNGLTSQSNQAFSAAGGSSAFQTLGFSDGSGVSFTNTNGSVGATVRTDYASSNHSHGNPTLALTNLTGTTASASNGLTLSLSAAAQSTQPVAVSGANGSYAFSTLSLSNANGISFGTSAGSAITASHNGITSQTVQTQSNVQGISAGTQVGRTGDIVFSNSNGISFGMSGSTQITASYTVPSTAGLISAVNFSAGTTSNNLSALTFSNSNGISFGLNASTLTASYTVPNTAGLISAVNFSGGTTSGNLGSIVFSNSNGVSFGLNGSTVTASVAGGGGAAISAGANSQSTGTVNFANSNGITFGLSNNGTMTASHNGITSQSNQQMTAFAASNTTQSSSGTYNASSMVFAGAGIASVGVTNGSVVISVPAGAPSPVNFSAGTTSGNLGSVVFSNSNGVSFGLNGSTVTGSVATSLTAINLSAGTTSNNLSAFVFSNSNRVSFGLNGSTVTAQHALNFSAGTTSNNISDGMTFSNSNGVSFGLNGSTLTASVATSLTAVNLSAGTTSNNLSAMVFSNSNGVSFGLNGSTMTASVVGGAITLSGFQPYPDAVLVAQAIGNGSFHINPIQPPSFQFDRIIMPINFLNTSNSSGSQTISAFLGLYTQNISTLSLVASTSRSYGITNSGTAGNYSLVSGLRNLSIAWTSTFGQSNYWVGVGINTASGGANASFSNLVISQINTNFIAPLSASGNNTNQMILGQGYFTATTAIAPNSIAFSQIAGSDSINRRPFGFHFASGTA